MFSPPKPTDAADGLLGTENESFLVPLGTRRDHDQPSIFRPENMMREARRQKRLAQGRVPPICVLDPDGDIVRYVRRQHKARLSTSWACYHTALWEWRMSGAAYGIVGSAVGASFAVLVAEQLFGSGCEMLISIASAGQITPLAPPPYHILIERALREEGTSYHYLPPSRYVDADRTLVTMAAEAFQQAGCSVRQGTTWTTDAPFRETADAVTARRREGILAVEMEAAALYALSAARGYPVLCVAHVSNQLGCIEGDFEKGHSNGACSSFDLLRAISTAWTSVSKGKTTELRHSDRTRSANTN